MATHTHAAIATTGHVGINVTDLDRSVAPAPSGAAPTCGFF